MADHDSRSTYEDKSREQLGELCRKLENIEKLLADHRGEDAPVGVLESVLDQVSVAGKHLLRMTRDLYYLGEDFDRFQGFAATLFESSPVALCVVDADAEIVQINDRAERQLGLRRDRWGELSLFDLFSEEQSERVRRALRRSRETDTSVSFEAPLDATGAGDPDAVQVTLLPLSDSPIVRGAALCMIRIGIEGEDPADDRIRQLQRHATLGKMATGLTHEFKNLLGVITTWAEIGQRVDDCPPSVREAFHKISHAANRGANLTDSVLEYGRGQRTDPGVLEVNTLLEQNARLFEPLLPSDIELSLELEARPSVIWFDETQFEQIVLNLVLNARDAIERHGQIRISTERVEDGGEEANPGGSHVAVAVSDTGCGMDAETLREASEPFYTTKESEGGTGLGLPTVRELVESADGELHIDSQPDRGTTVEVVFPLVERD